MLSQLQQGGCLHPVAFARSLSPAERNYSETDLETLAVVWAISHCHSYVYGCSVTVYTDHMAVRAVLETLTLQEDMQDSGQGSTGLVSKK